MSPTQRQSARAGPGVPWVTWLLLALFFVTFEVADWSTRSHDESSDSGLEEAAAYLNEHPYLEPGPELTGRLGNQVAKQRVRFEAERDRRGAMPIPAGIQRRQQETLDELVAEARVERGESPSWRFGLTPSTPRPESFLSHVFLHAGWVHLLGNLFLLLVLGVYLESAWGSLLFAGFFVLGAVASGASGVMAAPRLELPLIGATGLIAALFGAFAIRFAARADAAYAFVMLTGLTWLGLTAWLDVQWSVVADPSGSDPVVSARACIAMRIGGIFSGGIAAGLFALFGLERSALGTSRDSRGIPLSNPRLEKALDAQAQGRNLEAFELLSRALDEDATSPDVALAMWDVALSLGRAAEASGAMLRVLREDVRRADHQAVVDHWLELDERGLSADADFTLLIRVAAILRQEDQPSAALGALQLALSQAEASDSPVGASRVARAAKDLDSDTAEDAAWRALSSIDLSYEERQGLEEMLGELYRSRDRDPRQTGRARAYGKSGPHQREAPDSAPEPTTDAEAPDARPKPIDLDVGERALELNVVAPLALEEGGLRVELPDGQKRLLPYRSVDAMAVAAVHGLGAKPVILIDLVLNWMSLRDESLKVVRLRGDRFDPHLLCAGHTSAVEAVRGFLAELAERTDATHLPDANSAMGRPFAVLPDLATYQRDVLMAEGTPGG